ncbi:MAG: DUF4410 domain-containing protein [Verrucomicrobiae bacterium]|nr:DUF4410 domain-containing protein [Verrucomicrobiae bacterium]
MLPKSILPWTALLLLTGCASVSVKEPKQPKNIITLPTQKPDQIYVEPFSTKDAQFNVDREGAELATFKKDTACMLQDKLIKRLTELAPARAVSGQLPQTGWLIRGQFIRVNQGSRALRGIIGCGLGATKMETCVQVYDLSQSTTIPFLIFKTTGGSNAEPGAVLGAGPPDWITLGLVVAGTWNVVHGISEDAWRTAREIRNYLVTYCHNFD